MSVMRLAFGLRAAVSEGDETCLSSVVKAKARLSATSAWSLPISLTPDQNL